MPSYAAGLNRVSKQAASLRLAKINDIDPPYLPYPDILSNPANMFE